MTAHIIFLTAGEWPAQKGLLVSQVYETARALQSKGFQVSWFASIPLLSYLKRLLLRDMDLRGIAASCQANGIAFDYFIVPVTLGSPWSMPLRSWWHRRLAKRILRRLEAPQRGRQDTVLHARSYYAAEIAIQMRDLAHDRGQSSVIASFDMRSFLGPEAPMGHGMFGVATYGFLKQMEFDLIRDADVSFLPLNVGRRQYHEETGLNINYVPIQGLEREPGWTVEFDTRWSNQRIGYSGSLGQWHDPVLLRTMFELFPRLTPKLACKRIDAFDGLDCIFYKQSDLPNFYDSLLGLVIPGLAHIVGYYRTLQMRCNIFSTKAAEALSRGVPLIVSSELQELADFVRTHDCGLVVNVREGIASLPPEFDIESRALWERLTANAATVGKKFTRHAVIAVYERSWRTALELRQTNVSNT